MKIIFERVEMNQTIDSAIEVVPEIEETFVISHLVPTQDENC